MNKNIRLSVIIIAILLIFAGREASAQEVEKKSKFLFGIDYSLPYSLKNNLLYEGFGFDLLYFFKDEKFYSQLVFCHQFFRGGGGGGKSDQFVRSSGLGLMGGVRLADFKKRFLYLDIGAGTTSSREEGYSGAFYQSGIRLMEPFSASRFECSLRFIYYDFRKTKTTDEAISLGLAYWFPIITKKKS